jgi:hypothetical protein
MLVDLPHAGTYRIQADAAGFSQSRTARVGGRRVANVVVSWPQQAVARMGPQAPDSTIDTATGGMDGLGDAGPRSLPAAEGAR